MKRLLILCFFIVINLFANVTTLDDEKARNAAITLNYLHGSLNKIILYNDKIVLENEYNNIINNINLTVIDDKELIDTVTGLMDTLTNFRLTEMDREQFKKEYQQKLENSMNDALMGASSIRGSNPVEMAVNAVLGMGNAYLSYKTTQTNLKNDLNKSDYELDKNVLRDLNTIRKEFIVTYWGIMKKYNMPDKWRISENQFERFINILKSEDNDIKYNKLIRMKEELEILPMFWYELSLISRKLNKKDEELIYITKYEELNDKLLRDNSLYSLLLANKASYLNINTEQNQLKDILESIMKVDSLNGNRKIFVALKYKELGLVKEADKLLSENIDDNFLPIINKKLKLDLYLNNNITNKYDSTLDELLEKQNLSASEYLFYLGKRPTSFLLKEIDKELNQIKIEINKSIYGKSDLDVWLSKNWVLKDIENTDFELVIEDKETNFKTIKLENNLVKYHYSNVIDLDKYIKEDKFYIKFKLKHKLIPVTLVYEVSNLNNKPKNEDNKVKKEESTIFSSTMIGQVSPIAGAIYQAKDYIATSSPTIIEQVAPIGGVINQAKDLAIQKKDYISSKFLFTPIQILTDEKCFDVRNSMKECK